MTRSLHRALVALGLSALAGAWACDCDSSRITATLAELEAVPDPVVFGEVPVSTTRSQDVRLLNRGNGVVFLHGLEVTENTADFSLQLPEEVVLPYGIAPGNQVVFTIFYHPQQFPEADQGTVRITSTDKDAPEYDLACSGTAVEPILLVQPVPVDFGAVRVLSTGPATVVVTHTGSIPDSVSLTGVALSDDGDGDFSLQQQPDTPLPLAPGEHASIRLAYIPAAIDDADEGMLVLESDAESQERMEVRLLGSSFAPHIEVTPSALNFGTVSQGANPTLSLTVRNTGNAELVLQAPVLSNTGSQKFTLDPATAPPPIPPLGQQQIDVTYLADDRGDDDGTLRIEHDDPLERPVFINLHGRTPAPEVEIQPDYLSIQISGSSHTQTADIRIYNLGDERLALGGLEFDNPDGSFSLDAQPAFPATVEPGNMTDGPFETVVVRFTKDTATSDDTCYLTFTTDDPDEQTVVVTIVGAYIP